MWLLQFTDPNIIALPISFILAWLVSLMTRPMEAEHIERCWQYLRT